MATPEDESLLRVRLDDNDKTIDEEKLVDEEPKTDISRTTIFLLSFGVLCPTTMVTTYTNFVMFYHIYITGTFLFANSQVGLAPILGGAAVITVSCFRLIKQKRDM